MIAHVTSTGPAVSVLVIGLIVGLVIAAVVWLNDQEYTASDLGQRVDREQEWETRAEREARDRAWAREVTPLTSRGRTIRSEQTNRPGGAA